MGDKKFCRVVGVGVAQPPARHAAHQSSQFLDQLVGRWLFAEMLANQLRHRFGAGRGQKLDGCSWLSVADAIGNDEPADRLFRPARDKFAGLIAGW